MIQVDGLSGRVAVVTGADMPEKMGIMPSTQDETALAVDRVRYVGEPVAAVAALDEPAEAGDDQGGQHERAGRRRHGPSVPPSCLVE